MCPDYRVTLHWSLVIPGPGMDQAANCRNSKNLLPAVPATFIHSVDRFSNLYRVLSEEKSLKYISIIQRLVDN